MERMKLVTAIKERQDNIGRKMNEVAEAHKCKISSAEHKENWLRGQLEIAEGESCEAYHNMDKDRKPYRDRSNKLSRYLRGHEKRKGEDGANMFYWNIDTDPVYDSLRKMHVLGVKEESRDWGNKEKVLDKFYCRPISDFFLKILAKRKMNIDTYKSALDGSLLIHPMKKECDGGIAVKTRIKHRQPAIGIWEDVKGMEPIMLKDLYKEFGMEFRQELYLDRNLHERKYGFVSKLVDRLRGGK